MRKVRISLLLCACMLLSIVQVRALGQGGELPTDSTVAAEAVEPTVVSETSSLIQAGTTGNTIYTQNISDSSTGTGTDTDPYRDLKDAVAAASAGDTIVIKSSGFLNDSTGLGAPLVIDKALTIQGDGSNPTLTIRAGGIVLGADVTMKDFQISYANLEDVGFFANGHTLRVENVGKSASSATGVDLYTGTRAGSTAQSGTTGTIVITGDNTTVRNIYAGNYVPKTVSSTPSWTGGSDISVIGKTTITKIYGRGFDRSSNTPTVPTVGDVTIRLTDPKVNDIDGEQYDDLGGRKANVEFTGGQYANTSLSLSNVKKLTVKGGTLKPAKLNSNVSLAIEPSAVLDLSTVVKQPDAFGDYNDWFDIENFDGGGTLRNDKGYKLVIYGSVTGSTNFQTTNNQPPNNSTSGLVDLGMIYITTPADAPANAFTFVPYATQDTYSLVKVADAANSLRANWQIQEKQVSKESLTGATVQVTGTYTYSGQAIVPQASEVTVTLADGQTVVPSSDYTITASNNINAGQATIQVTANPGTNYSDSATGTFQIDKKQVQVNADAKTIFYGQSTPELTYTLAPGTDSGVSLTGSLQLGQDNVTIEQGSLAISNPNYELDFRSAQLTVNETTPRLVITADHMMQVAGESVAIRVTTSNPYNPAAADVPQPTVTYQIGNDPAQQLNATGGTIAIPVSTPVGTVITVQATSAADTGKYTQGSHSIQIQVTDKIVVDDLIVLTQNNLEYGQQPAPKSSLKGTEEAGAQWTFTYSKDNGVSYHPLDNLKNNGFIPAGDYRVKVSYEDSRQVGAKEIGFSVAKKKLTVNMDVSAITKVYDKTTQLVGSQPQITLSGAVGTEQPILDQGAVRYAYDNADAGTGKQITAQGIRLSTDSINENYTVAESHTASGAVIQAKELEVVPLAGQSKQYGYKDPSAFAYKIATTGEETTVLTGALGRMEGEGPGTYAYTIGTLSGGQNYKLVLGGAGEVFVIEQGKATLTLDSNLVRQQAGKAIEVTVTARHSIGDGIASGSSHPTIAEILAVESGETLTLEQKENGIFTGIYQIPQDAIAGSKIILKASTKDANYFAATDEIEITVSETERYALLAPTENVEGKQLKLEMERGVSKISDAVKEALKLNTAEEIKAHMRMELTSAAAVPGSNIEVYDVSLMVSENGQSWEKATVDTFPQGGITVTLPYPDGTTKDSHDFWVVHMFTENQGSVKAGQMEMPAITKAVDGIRFKVSSLSPISLGWKEIEVKENTPPGTQGGGTSQPQEPQGEAASQEPPYNEALWKEVEKNKMIQSQLASAAQQANTGKTQPAGGKTTNTAAKPSTAEETSSQKGQNAADEPKEDVLAQNDAASDKNTEEKEVTQSPVEPEQENAAKENGQKTNWWLIAGIVVVAAAIIAGLIFYRQKREDE
ncbi:MAG: YDG domain-containing protein [Roseburia sp.]